ncbi:TetR/AcrR family transcriptional regulator [Planococcus sp. N028]|uniref:TetR/AcrR family transcriptional regulator n=1 Tax=Planococcus shixiaomingii TaxID=3058393 RepID=A0ABT8MYX7_9BACL|nr:TetR/AcrR family transcriptional regulator [Planococcus sp. N028]MDN7240837.1 TetR/AcrR family transcriptional regulator [Planococcus sp. N028]
MKPTDLRVVKTKEALQEALLTLLNQKTLISISVTEICKLAKINRGTFYSHYGQIEELFEEYFKGIMKDLASSYKEPYRHVRTLDPKHLNPGTIRIFHHIEKHKNFYRIVFSKQVPFSYYHLLYDQVCSLMKNDFGIYNQIIRAPSMVSAYQANAILGMVIEWHKEDFRQSANEMNVLLVHILNKNLS